MNWAHGPVNKGIRRIAGFGDDANVEEIAAGLDDQDDYLTGQSYRHNCFDSEERLLTCECVQH